MCMNVNIFVHFIQTLGMCEIRHKIICIMHIWNLYYTCMYGGFFSIVFIYSIAYKQCSTRANTAFAISMPTNRRYSTNLTSRIYVHKTFMWRLNAIFFTSTKITTIKMNKVNLYYLHFFYLFFVVCIMVIYIFFLCLFKKKYAHVFYKCF